MSDLGTDPRPRVILPRELVPVPVAIGMGAILTLGLFAYLLPDTDGSEGGGAKLGRLPAQTAPPELVLPPDPAQPPAAPYLATVIPQRALPRPMAERSSFVRPQAYLPSPSEPSPPVDSPPAEVDQLRPRGAGGAGMPIAIDLGRPPVGNGERGIDPDDPDAGRMNLRDGEAVRATRIRSRLTIVPQGAIIAAVLETPLNSDRPGLARALISQDVYGFDGTRLLIPRGSRLVGEFKPEAAPGLRRIPVLWTRLIRPDGVAIRIASPGADPLGGAGIGGRVNTHFAQKLFGAVLQSALTVGVNVLSNSASVGGNPIYVGLPGQAQQVGEQIVPKVDRPPTVSVRPGAQISVLVARDLDFSGTPPVR